MAESLKDRFVQKGPWQALFLAVTILAIGQMTLLWQYRRLEGKRIQELEQRQAIVEQQIEERAAHDTLREFLEARIAGDAKAFRYVTEQAALQYQQGAFEVFGAQNYEVQEGEKLGEEMFRFRVELIRDRVKQVEIVEVLKIGENYYVNSVQLAG